MWIVPHPTPWVRDTDPFEQLDGPAAGLLAGQTSVMNAQRLGDLVHNPQRRVQRRHRILEHHPDLLATHRT